MGRLRASVGLSTHCSKHLLAMKVFFSLVLLAACALATPIDPPHHGGYHEEPKPYAYAYAVKDDYSGANFNAQEQADGKAVHGSYQVYLPDGRVQTVTYTADHYNGYVADVKYDGVAKFPKYEPKPSYGHH